MDPAVDQLVADTRAGDRRAREQLARWCLPRVRRTVAVACGRGPEGDDIVQNVMAVVLTKLHSYRGDAAFYVWVDRITINEIRSVWRKQSLVMRKLKELAADPSLRSAPGPSPSSQLGEDRLFVATAAHIQRLKPGHRLPVTLSLLHGYTTPEIAALMEIQLEAAKKRLQRGRKELEERLRRDPACRDYFEGGTR